jgi:hypothetical protein
MAAAMATAADAAHPTASRAALVIIATDAFAPRQWSPRAMALASASLFIAARPMRHKYADVKKTLHPKSPSLLSSGHSENIAAEVKRAFMAGSDVDRAANMRPGMRIAFSCTWYAARKNERLMSAHARRARRAKLPSALVFDVKAP